MPLPVTETSAAPRRFLRDRAFDMLLGAIQDGQVVPGEVLQDEELMAWLGMSRTPIRHALIRLAEAGLVEMSAGRQTIVAELSQERTNRALMVSGMFNTYAVRRLGGRFEADQLAVLARHRATLERLTTSESPAAMAQAVAAFFGAITSACGNAVVDEQVGRLEIELALFLRPSAAASTILLDRMVEGVAAIDDALQAGDRERALAAVRALYDITRVNFVDRFREPEID
jgi:DNA-binding GntR family transcriptional regulator